MTDRTKDRVASVPAQKKTLFFFFLVFLIVVRAAAANVNLRFQGCAGPVPSLCRPVWYPGLGSTRLWSGKPGLGSLGNESRIILLFFVALSLSPPESWSGANSMACQKAVEIVFPISQLASK